MLFWDVYVNIFVGDYMKDNNNELKMICDRIRTLIESNDISYGELSKQTGIPKSALHRYATGETLKIPLDRIEQIANAFRVSSAWIMGWEEEQTTLPNNILPIPQMKKVPLLGTIACGEPIIAEENIEDIIDMPPHIHADFALKCKGDSMIGARILNGDIVYIHHQPDVENGEIAAVLIDDEATLKRIYKYNDMVVLRPENPAYSEMVYKKEEMNHIKIIGKAVGFYSNIK